MSNQDSTGAHSTYWPPVATTALRVAFGVIWAVGAALTWSPDFAVHYVGYLHNAAAGQPGWSAWWFNMWIAIVSPNPALFTWATRIIETVIAVALIAGLGRRTLYALGALFSVLIWSTAEGFAGPYTVGATNMGTALTYVLIFVALIGLDYRSGFIPYSLDYLIERRWPAWRRISQWTGDKTRPTAQGVLPWGVQVPSMLGVVVLLLLLLFGMQSALNVKSASPATASAAVSPLALASNDPIASTRDPRLPPLAGTGDSVDVHLVSTDDQVSIASGVKYNAWTFGGTVPGPIIHVRQGQTVNVTYTNKGLMQHSIDFHAAITPPNKSFREVDPGETIHFSFVAKTPGAFLYHCGTAPVLLHIGNGMYGALVVSPKNPLPPAAESYVIVQSEWYTRQVDDHVMGGDFEKMKAATPDEVVFNGAAFQYKQHPLPVEAGQRVRLYFVNAGPNLWSSFHVIGGIFDKVYPDGNPDFSLSGVSTYSVGPGAGAIFDLVFNEPGLHPFVDHSMAHAIRGAQGVLYVYEPGADHPPAVVKASDKPAKTEAKTEDKTATAKSEPKAQVSGPYAFDPAKGKALYRANCSACHQASGEGLPGAFPPLKNDPVVDANDPTEHIQTVLWGARGRTINGAHYATPMPPFASALNDHEVADIINHERTSWGNHAPQVTADEVAKQRAAGKN